MRTDPVTWSAEAEEAHREAQGRRRGEQGAWERGPTVADGKLVIPSDFYNARASGVYKRLGMRYDDIGKWWHRDITVPFKGRVYSADAWLRAARKAYKEVWPTWDPQEGAS